MTGAEVTTDGLEAAIDAERETTSARITPIRLAVVASFWLLIVGLGWGAGELDWRTGFPLFTAYLVTALLLFVVSRVWKGAGRRFAWALALLDVPLIYLLQRSTFESSSSPGAVAGFTIGIFAGVVAVAALSLDLRQLGAVTLSAMVFGVVLQREAGISVGGQVAAVVVLGFTALAGMLLYRRMLSLTQRLLDDVAYRRKLQAELEHADRMATLGLLSASIAHEVGNPLQVLYGNLELVQLRLKSRPAELQRAEDELAAALRSVDRLGQLLDDIRGMARRDTPTLAETHVQRVVEGASKLARSQVAQRAQLVLELHEVPTVRMSESRLSQVLLNLLLNAGQAIPEGDRGAHAVTVRTRTGAAGEALISVTDTGSGISPEHLERLFTPFFTTKPAGQGTGLGLTISAQLVRDVGGRIEVDSAPGRGTTFTVRLPPASAPPPDLARGPSSWRQKR